MRSLLAAALPLVALAGCVGAPDYCVRVDAGEVCAPTREQARDVAARIDVLAAAVRAELPELTDAPLDVWLQPEPQVVWLVPAGADVGAMTNSLTGRIHARQDSPDLDTDLAHEMVHALLSEVWDGLPATLEEGLCDQVASRIARGGERLRADRLLRAIAGAGGPGGALRLDFPSGGWSEQRLTVTSRAAEGVDARDVFTRDASLVRPFHADRGRPVWYGLAFVAAGRLLARHGADGMLALVQRVAALDEDAAAKELAAAAGLAAPPSWHAAILTEATHEDRAAIAAHVARPLAEKAVEIVRARSGSGPLAERVAAARPRFRLGPVGQELVDLLGVPAFLEELDAAVTQASRSEPE